MAKLAVVLVVAAAAAFVAWRHGAGPAHARGADGATNDEAVRAEVAELKRQVAVLQTRVAAPRPVTIVHEASAPAAPPATAPAEQPPTPPKSIAESVHAQATTLEERLASEPVDRAWSTEQAVQMRVAIAGARDADVRDIQCAATLCRVVVEHQTADAQRALGRTIGSESPFQTGVLYVYDHDSTPLRTTLYVLREGHPFAPPLPL